jgi:membrane-associated phospholipid phosphatase
MLQFLNDFTGSIRSGLAAGAARDPERVAGAAVWLIVWALLCLTCGGVLVWTSGYHGGFLPLNALAAELPSSVWQWLTSLGDERVAFALALLFSARHPRVFWTLICAALVAIAYSRGLKPIVDAARPPAVLAPESFQLIGDGHRGKSFPSGHSVTAAVFFGVLAYYAQRLHWRLVFLLLATLAGLSRVAVGVHWPVDVAAGLAGGALAALAGVWLARRSLWGIYDEGVHLAFVALAMFAAVGLLFDHGGYPAAALPLQVLAWAGLVSAAIAYLWLPARRLLPGGAVRAKVSAPGEGP